MSTLSNGAEIAERALAAARGEATVILVSESSHANLRWAGNSLTTNGASRDHDLTVISMSGRGYATRSTTSVESLEDITELVRATESAAADSSDAEDYLPLAAGSADADFTAAAEHVDIAALGPFAADLGGALEQAKAAAIRLYGFASMSQTTTWLASSTGHRRRHVEPIGLVEWNAKGDHPGGSVWHGQSTRTFTDIDVAATVAGLEQRLSWTERRVALDPGRYDTILPPAAAADLMIYLYWTAAGRDADDGRNVFSRAGGGTRIGEMLAPAGLNLTSDPDYPGLETAPFVTCEGSSALASVFDNGMPSGQVSWISDGELTALVETRSSAASAGRAFTPAAGNLILDAGGTQSLPEMVAGVERGLLLTCLWYIREVDPQTLLLTGLTRDGVYLVEGGEVVGAVNNFRFNESPVDLLGRVSATGRTERCLSREWSDYFTLTAMPPLRVPDFNMSSISPAS